MLQILFIFRQTANKILLNNCLNIKCTFSWRVNPSHLGFPTQIPVLCIKPSIRSRSQLCQYASAEVFVRWSGSMWNPLSTHTFLVSFFATFKNPRAHPLHVATGQVCGGEEESGATSFCFLFFCFVFFFRFSRFLFIFPATPRMPSLSITAGFSPHLRLQWLRETLNTCLHGWTVSFHFFSFKHVFLSILTSLKIYIWYWYHTPFST